MSNIKFIKAPNSEHIKPIVDGVISYGESLVQGNNPKKHAFHLIEKEQLIGGIIGARQYNRYYLSHIWVSENHRNNGYGSALLSSCEKQLSNMGCTSIILETLNEKAVKFYLKNGYSSVSKIKEYVQGFDLVHLLKKI